MNIKDIIPADLKDLLTEESLTAIQEAVDNKISLAVESALVEQDDLFAGKLKELVEVRDKDYANKLKRIIESKDKAALRKLQSVVKKYQQDVVSEATEFKNDLVDKISNYMEEFLDEAIPSQAIMEATQNKTATKVLSDLRKVLAIDSALMNESVKSAVADGNNQLQSLKAQVEQLTESNKTLVQENTGIKAQLILEQKTAGFNEDKKKYITRVLGDKSPEFINENFDYTIKLFEKDQKKENELLKEQALKTRVVKEDAPARPVTTSQKRQQAPASQTSVYLSELDKAK